MKICLIAAFPPSGRALNEYSFHIAKEIQRHEDVELVILADRLDDESTQQSGSVRELPGFNVIRCWTFGSTATPLRLLREVRRQKPDIVWFNLVYSSFANPESPLAAFAGLSAPAMTRALGFYTHITLHHITEHIDFAQSGVKGARARLYRIGTNVITRTLLKAHSVSVLLSAYRRTLVSKYAAENIVLGTHGVFAALPSPPDFSRRGNPEQRILAFGHWGTYKRLEVLLEAFPEVLRRVPNARLIIGGGNHSARPGYLESLQATIPADMPVEFRGYIPSKDVPELFATSTVLVMPYDSSTGSSGPAHQACEFGVPIICADIFDFHCMATDEDMAIQFYELGNAGDLADKLTALLQSPSMQRQMAKHNYEAGVQMTMASIARNYLRWFELQRYKRTLHGGRLNPARWLKAGTSWLGSAKEPALTLEADFMPSEHGGVSKSESGALSKSSSDLRAESHFKKI